MNEYWKSKKGFVLAAAGSAVGLANVWKFPNEAFEGGGSFIIIYLICLLLIGLPLLLCEISIGAVSNTGVFKSFEKLGYKSWGSFGYLAMITGTLLLGFYAVVGGWCFYYSAFYLLEFFKLTSPLDFSVLCASPIEQIFSTLMFMICTITIVRKGITGGIEKAIQWLMSLLIVLLLVFAYLALRETGLSLPIRYLLDFDASKITSDLLLSAVGHSFFTLSVGIGVMLVFASYLRDQDNIPKASLWILVIDTMIALTAFCIVLPVILSLQKQGIDFNSGADKLFIAIPALLSNIAQGSLLGSLFYLLLSVAAITSSVSILEVLVSGYMNKFDGKVSRNKSTLVMGGLLCIIACLTSLSLGANTFLSKLNLFSLMSTVVSDYLLTIGGLLICIFVGWFMTEEHKRQIVHNNTLYLLWNFIIKYAAPIIIIAIMLCNIL